MALLDILRAQSEKLQGAATCVDWRPYACLFKPESKEISRVSTYPTVCNS